MDTTALRQRFTKLNRKMSPPRSLQSFNLSATIPPYLPTGHQDRSAEPRRLRYYLHLPYDAKLTSRFRAASINFGSTRQATPSTELTYYGYHDDPLGGVHGERADDVTAYLAHSVRPLDVVALCRPKHNHACPAAADNPYAAIAGTYPCGDLSRDRMGFEERGQVSARFSHENDLLHSVDRFAVPTASVV